LLSNKSITKVFLTPFWYVNVKSEAWKPISLIMLKLVIRLWMSSTTCKQIECFSKVLDGTPITCGSGIGRRLDVVFKVSSTIIMSFVLNFKSWKLNNGVLTSFYTTSRIWSWHSIDKWIIGKLCVFLMYMYS
jgi:hypothetical protein